MKIGKKKSQNENALKKIFKPIMGGARWMIFFRLLRCDVVTTNLLRDVSKLNRLERGTEMFVNLSWHFFTAKFLKMWIFLKH